MFSRQHIISAVLAAAVGSPVVVMGATSYEEAEVLSSTPIYHVVEITTPRQECWEQEVVRQTRPNDAYRSGTSSILGAVIGGAVGNAVGHGKRNSQVGTVVGAILGSSIARDISHTNERRNSVEYIDTVERCRTVQSSRQEEKLVGYDVRYSYNGMQQTVRMSEDPGATVKVRVNVEPVF